jgi:hypothetical protein
MMFFLVPTSEAYTPSQLVCYTTLVGIRFLVAGIHTGLVAKRKYIHEN